MRPHLTCFFFRSEQRFEQPHQYLLQGYLNGHHRKHWDQRRKKNGQQRLFPDRSRADLLNHCVHGYRIDNRSQFGRLEQRGFRDLLF